jgi:membrane-associated phospholipid phosphatase
MSEWTPPRAAVEAEADVKSERLARTARWISNLFSPATLALPAMVMAVYVSHEPGSWRYAALYMLVGVVVPLVDIIWQLHIGNISDFHLSSRQERRRPFLVSTICLTVALLVFQATDAPPVMMAMAQATLLQTLVLFGFTLVWQISVHMATVTSIVTFMLLAFGSEALPFTLLVPLVGWSRLYLGRHNLPQLVAGGIVGVTSMLVCLAGVLY